jgi:hypothetical protein
MSAYAILLSSSAQAATAQGAAAPASSVAAPGGWRLQRALAGCRTARLAEHVVQTLADAGNRQRLARPRR